MKTYRQLNEEDLVCIRNAFEKLNERDIGCFYNSLKSFLDYLPALTENCKKPSHAKFILEEFMVGYYLRETKEYDYFSKIYIVSQFGMFCQLIDDWYYETSFANDLNTLIKIQSFSKLLYIGLNDFCKKLKMMAIENGKDEYFFGDNINQGKNR